MSKRVSIKQVAAHAGVSVATVSLVLNNKGRISEGTKKQVLKSVKALEFIPNRSASRLRSGRSLLIGLIVNDISNPFFAELSSDVENEAAQEGYLSVMANTGDSLERQAQVIETMIGQGVAGFIISAANGSDASSFHIIREYGIPYVLCVRDILDTSADFVGFDNMLAGSVAASHLVELGHRSVAFVGAELTNPNRRRRIDGVKETLAQKGGGICDSMDLPGPATRQFGFDAVAGVLNGNDRPTAIVCFNDHVALGAYAAIANHGLKVGRDISVIGFDNVPESSVWMPPLTTVELYPRALGARSAKTLLARVGGDDAAAERIFLSPEIVARQSTCAVEAR